ncbi:MAG: ATP-binding protein [Oscillospiraceae bacterium]|nr:ATP-binding protein [Oscillospiraceae bacterium]
MAKVILICGKICSGKSTYAKRLVEKNTVLLSVDEIMLALFGMHVGDKHDEYVERTEKYLFNKSLEIIAAGINVILDWGLWTKSERIYAREFYKTRNIECELRYIDICDETWKLRLDKRNKAVSTGEIDAYFVDDNLAAKFNAIFEAPDNDEIDVRIKE